MISSTGVGSGLDVNSIVTSLMAIERRPLQLLQQRASTIQTKISAFGALQSQIANLGDVANRLAVPSNFAQTTATSSVPASVAVTAGTGAATGNFSVSVSQLAQAHSLASNAFTPSEELAIGTGKLSISVGSATPVDIDITDTNQTLAGVRDAINAAGAGVSASIVRDNSGARLVLRATQSGADSEIKVTATDTAGDPVTSATGLGRLAYDATKPVGSGRNLVQTQAAQDAQYNINGLDLTSSSNTITTAVEGLTLTLKAVTTAPADIGVSVDSAAVRKNVTDFVKAYNDLNTLLQNQTRADPTGTSTGALQGDSTAVGLLSRLRSTLQGNVTGLQGTNSLSAAGLELQRDGSLKINETRLAPLLADPKQLSALFSSKAQDGDASTRGFAVRFSEFAATLTSVTTGLSTRTESLKQSVKLNQNQQGTAEDRLTRIEARLRAQYQRLDTEMTKLNSQMAFVNAKFGTTNNG
ncbi:MAG: flagellar hook protein [Betaproteobacteria bacterium HGW-Betaproteobacteria-3]|jgi:flagellar hook-associated protein 2|nr:MAG: flagellar hook protein [Betaproteobacteria bacterium HGW-Betaproteobacteria-3]